MEITLSPDLLTAVSETIFCIFVFMSLILFYAGFMLTSTWLKR